MKHLDASPAETGKETTGFITRNKKKIAAATFVAAGLAGAAGFANKADYESSTSVGHNSVLDNDSTQVGIQPTPETMETVDIKQFVDFRDTGAETSNVEILSEGGTFVAIATIAAEEFKDLTEYGMVAANDKEYGVRVDIDFVANKPIKIVNFAQDYQEYELGPSIVMSRADSSAQRDTTNFPNDEGHYAHFELPIHSKDAMFPEGKDMVITFEGLTTADQLGARIVPMATEHVG